MSKKMSQELAETLAEVSKSKQWKIEVRRNSLVIKWTLG